MNKLRHIVPATLIICLLAGVTSQCGGSADGNAKGTPTNLTAAPTSESISRDPDWDVNNTSSVPQITGYGMSCSSSAYCWIWDTTSLWAYDQQQKIKRLSIELHQNEFILNGFLLSSEVGWIVTSRGLFQTSDSGAHWRKVDTPDFDNGKGRIRAIYFADEKQGWMTGGTYQQPLKGETVPNNAVSDDGKLVLIGAIAKTADGGRSWQDVRLERSIGRFDKVTFTNNLGIVSGDAGLRVSTNGGADWKDVLSEYSRKDTGEKPQVKDTFLLTERLGWASLGGARLISTDDGARSWRVIYPSSASDLDDLSFDDIVFVDELRGLGMHTSMGRAQLYKTNNGGKAWTPMITQEGFSALERVPGNRLIIAVGKRGIYSMTPRAAAEH